MKGHPFKILRLNEVHEITPPGLRNIAIKQIMLNKDVHCDVCGEETGGELVIILAPVFRSNMLPDGTITGDGFYLLVHTGECMLFVLTNLEHIAKRVGNELISHTLNGGIRPDEYTN